MIFYVILCVLLAVGSGVNVGGPIFRDTTWTRTKSPYVLTSDYQVPVGVRLTIQAGVEVRFDENFQILVRGKLTAQGTAAQPIQFNGTSAIGWGGGVVDNRPMVVFIGTYLTNSSLTFCRFMGPKNGLDIGGSSSVANWGNLQISDIDLDGSSLVTTGTESNATVTVKNGQLHNCTIQGLSHYGEPMFFRNVLIDNTKIYTAIERVGLVFDSCRILDTGIAVSYYTSAVIRFNRINGTDISITSSAGSYDYGNQLSVSSSRIVGMKVDLGYSQLSIQSSEIKLRSEDYIIIGLISITCSTIIGEQQDVGIKVTGLRYSQFLTQLSITNSTVSNFSTALRIVPPQTSYPINIRQTNFLRAGLYHIENRSTQNLTTTACWWGTNKISSIRSKIYDYYKDIKLGEVFLNRIAQRVINNTCATA